MKIKIELDNDVRLVWPTPIFSRLYPDTSDMNARLLEIVHPLPSHPGILGGAQSMVEYCSVPFRRPCNQPKLITYQLPEAVHRELLPFKGIYIGPQKLQKSDFCFFVAFFYVFGYFFDVLEVREAF